MRVLLQQIAAGNTSLMGAMIESNLEAGSQPFPSRAKNFVTGCRSPTRASTGRPPKRSSARSMPLWRHGFVEDDAAQGLYAIPVRQPGWRAFCLIQPKPG